MSETFFQPRKKRSQSFLCRTGCETDTNLLIGSVVRGISPEFAVLDDWMPGKGDKEQVFELFSEASELVDFEQREKVGMRLKKIWKLIINL